jgi:uncharacterized membrane protein YfhO
VLEELAKEFREKLNKYSSSINKVVLKFVELMITPHLQTLDLRWWRGNINVLRLAGLKIPVRNLGNKKYNVLRNGNDSYGFSKILRT